MRELNPKDVSLAQRSFGLALAVVLLFSFTRIILKLLIPVLVLTIVIFLVLKFVYRSDKFKS